MKNIVDKYIENLGKDFFLLGYHTNRVDFYNSVKDLEVSTLMELRAFNNDGELRIWRKPDGSFDGRYKSDAGGDEQTFETEFILWGDSVKDSRISQSDRGASYDSPIKVSKNELPLKVKVINYYKYDERGLIVFTDARLADVIKGGQNG